MKYVVVLFILVSIGMSIQMVDAAYPSPAKQFKSGIPLESILCIDDKILVERSNGKPACVTERTQERTGWRIVNQLPENWCGTQAFCDESTNNIENEVIIKDTVDDPNIINEIMLEPILTTDEYGLFPDHPCYGTVPGLCDACMGGNMDDCKYPDWTQQIEVDDIRNDFDIETIPDKITTPNKPTIEPELNKIKELTEVEFYRQLLYQGSHTEEEKKKLTAYFCYDFLDDLVLDVAPGYPIGQVCNFEDDVPLLLDPRNLKAIVSQDPENIYQTVLEMPPADPDAFAQKMADFFDDTILEKKSSYDRNSYITVKGDITILKDIHVPDLGYGSTFTYTIYEEHMIHPNKADVVTEALLKELGITLDGNEWHETIWGSVTGHWYKQNLNGWYPGNNIIIADFGGFYTYIRLGAWHIPDNTIELYDWEQARKNAAEHIFKYEALTDPNCDLSYDEREHWNGFSLIHGRPVYTILSGVCQVDMGNYHFMWYDVVVDAIDGKPLYVKSKTVF